MRSSTAAGAFLDRFEKAGENGENVLANEERQAALRALNHAAYKLEPPLHELEHTLHPWVVFAIMPIFALANAGVQLGGGIADALRSPVTLGIFAGLVVGKQFGITLFAWLAVRSGVSELPRGSAGATSTGRDGWRGSASRCLCSSPTWDFRTARWSTPPRSASWPPRWSPGWSGGRYSGGRPARASREAPQSSRFVEGPSHAVERTGRPRFLTMFCLQAAAFSLMPTLAVGSLVIFCALCMVK